MFFILYVVSIDGNIKSITVTVFFEVLFYNNIQIIVVLVKTLKVYIGLNGIYCLTGIYYYRS